ncbi:MAG: acyl-CoA dehydrogenase family protein [Halieaceae bacterium]
MDSLDTFRGEVRNWLAANCPESQRQKPEAGEQYWGGRNASFPSADAQLWFERMLDRGWTAPEWPVEYGGGGLDEAEAKVLKEEMKSIGARAPLLSLGIWMLGPAILEYGTEAQKQTFITSILRGETRWCQGYSEPGSGSDLASLQCRAEDKGDHFLVNGSKIWTSRADQCDWIFCLVRTDPDAVKQEGISFLLIDMDDAGVSTSPIGLISGESEFCQTFFDNVRVPKDNLVGELNQGWSVAKSLLKHERKLMSEMGGDIPSVDPRAMLKDHVAFKDGKIADPELRRQQVEYDMMMHALGLTHFRGFEERQHGVAGDSVLIMKYVGTEAEKAKGELLLALLGSQGLGWEGTEFSDDELAALRQWAMSKTLTIAGGTSEIQLNIIAKRALGLPQ